MRAASRVQLVELFEEATALANRDNVADEARCIDALSAMQQVSMTTALLIDTQLGKRLRTLAKHRNPEISSAAGRVIDAWKKVVIAEADAKLSTASVADGPVRSPGLTGSARMIVSRHVNDGGVDNDHAVKSKSEESEVSSEVGTAAAATTGVKTGARKLKTLPRCGNAIRDKIQDLLVGAFTKVLDEVEGEYLQKARACDLLQVAVTTEMAMFDKLGIFGKSTLRKKLAYHSLMFNLRDSKNPDLRRRVLIGEITAEKLVSMSTADMASDERKMKNECIKAKALFECERGLKAAASTDIFKCGKCQQRKCTYFQMQTRSADEPMTTYVTCVNCNNHWKFC